MFEKFDAAGDDLFSIIHSGIITRHEIFQMRFINVAKSFFYC
jgi:hypothetical protein